MPVFMLRCNIIWALLPKSIKCWPPPIALGVFLNHSASPPFHKKPDDKKNAPTMTTNLYTHKSFHTHEVPPGHVEHGGRYLAVENALRAEQFADLSWQEAPRADLALAGLVHPEIYADKIASAVAQETSAVAQENTSARAPSMAQLDADTFMGPSSLDATLRAAGGAAAGVDAVFSGQARNAFVAARPPGHHAEPDRAMGFCLFNHVAIAAHHARQRHGVRRVGVVDFDVHHGNGTEAIFWHDEEAFFASSHEWPQYPGTGRESDRGGFDNICNAPLPTGTDGKQFTRAWGEKLLPALSDFNPEIIIISAGFDGHAADPLGGFALVESDYAWLTEQLMQVANGCCNGRIVSVLEGGYDLDALGSSVAAHVGALTHH